MLELVCPIDSDRLGFMVESSLNIEDYPTQFSPWLADNRFRLQREVNPPEY